MPSVVEICNLALGHLGDRATVSSISPPEGSAQADHCAQFWPIARDEALSSYDWRFASTVTSLTALDDTLNIYAQWEYAFALPADFLVARELNWNSDTVWFWDDDSLPMRFDFASVANGEQVILSNEQYTTLRYTRKVITTSRFPSKLVTAMSYLLASYLAGPVVKGRAGVGYAKAMRENYEFHVGQAAAIDANQTRHRTKHTAAGLRARGYTGDSRRTVEDGPYRRELPYWAS